MAHGQGSGLAHGTRRNKSALGLGLRFFFGTTGDYG